MTRPCTPGVRTARRVPMIQGQRTLTLLCPAAGPAAVLPPITEKQRRVCAVRRPSIQPPPAFGVDRVAMLSADIGLSKPIVSIDGPAVHSGQEMMAAGPDYSSTLRLPADRSRRRRTRCRAEVSCGSLALLHRLNAEAVRDVGNHRSCRDSGGAGGPPSEALRPGPARVARLTAAIHSS
jgi:hypothetical protein